MVIQHMGEDEKVKLLEVEDEEFVSVGHNTDSGNNCLDINWLLLSVSDPTAATTLKHYFIPAMGSRDSSMAVLFARMERKPCMAC